MLGRIEQILGFRSSREETECLVSKSSSSGGSVVEEEQPSPPPPQDEEGSSSDLRHHLTVSSSSCNLLDDRRYRITSLDAGWNVTNAIQGLFVIALPYTVLHSGCASLILMAIVAVISCYTGNILIDCLYETDEENKTVRVRSSYVDVAVACWGPRLGTWTVNVAQICELVSTCVLYVVVSANLLSNSFPYSLVKQSAWSVIVSIVLFFCIFLRDLGMVSKLSLGCTVVHLLVIAFIVIYCFLKIDKWAWSKLTVGINNHEFPVSVGAIVFSYTSQIFLPSLEESMTERKEFRSMLGWSYAASGFVKVLLSLVCFLTWADATKEVVTDNLPPSVRPLINCLLAVKALLSYPLPYFVAVEFLEDWICSAFPSGQHYFGNPPRPASGYENISIYTLQDFARNSPSDERLQILEKNERDPEKNQPQKVGRMKKLMDVLSSQMRNYKLASLFLRTFFVVVTLVVAIYLPYFALLMAFTGSLAGVPLSIILPCIFHLQLKWKQLKWHERGADIFIFIVGLLCTFSGLFMSAFDLDSASKTMWLAPSPNSNNFTEPHNSTLYSWSNTTQASDISFDSGILGRRVP